MTIVLERYFSEALPGEKVVGESLLQLFYLAIILCALLSINPQNIY